MTAKSTKKPQQPIVTSPTDEAVKLFQKIKAALQGTGKGGAKWVVPPTVCEKQDPPPVVID